MDSQETMLFLKEREERLGAKIIYRTFSTWYARIGHEKREYGVFLYTDGRTIVFEDFDREPQLLGIPLKRKNKEKYEKLEVSFPVTAIRSIERVSLSDASDAFDRNDAAEAANQMMNDRSPSTSVLRRYDCRGGRETGLLA